MERTGSGISDVVRLLRVRELARSGEARRLRLDAGLSLAEMGAPCGVDQATVWRWETGRRRPKGAPALTYEEILRAIEHTTSPGVGH